jgi:small subunit ribosomal protein S10
MQKLRIKLKAYDSKVLDQVADQIIGAAVRSGAKVAGPVPLPTRRKLWAVQRSPFVHSKHMDHFEMRIHLRLIDIYEPNQKTIDTLTHLQLAAGVAIEIK